jgi:pimeloyl-ACP methyl ester carboxylesterase
MEDAMPVVDVRDTRLYYETAGEKEPTLLFIHGMCGGVWNWHDQFSRLSDEFRCISYDRRGHGRSESGTKDQSLRTHVDDAAALIEALELNKPLLVGSSAGGAITLELVYRYPQLMCGAVVIEPPLLNLVPEEEAAFRAELKPIIEEALANDRPRDAVDGFFNVVCAQFWAQADETRRESLRGNAPMMFAALQSQGATLTLEELASINHPILLVGGVDSPPIMHSIADILRDTLSNVRFLEVQNSGHVVYAEQPEVFAEAVTSFARASRAVTASNPA